MGILMPTVTPVCNHTKSGLGMYINYFSSSMKHFSKPYPPGGIDFRTAGLPIAFGSLFSEGFQLRRAVHLDVKPYPGPESMKKYCSSLVCQITAEPLPIFLVG